MISLNRTRVEDFVIKNGTPVTEMCNRITQDIDLCTNGEQILALLSQTDEEIFSGSELSDEIRSDGFENDHLILNRISCLSELIREQVEHQLKNPSQQFKIILSGCGTSGRLAYLCSQTFSKYLKSSFNEINYNLCDYIIAGDEFALVNSVEAVEDKAHIGAEKLKNILDQHSNSSCVFIGITCGLSAPFVAGQIDHCLKDPRVKAFSLIGFNPLEMTRKTHAVNRENESFYHLIQKITTKTDKIFFPLNPIIGPEPITGSTRMKSGTTTKIILDLILTKTICLLSNKEMSDQIFLIFYKQAKFCVYSEEIRKLIGVLIDKSSDALRNLNNGGSINYCSSSERLGLLCCVDASECLPTYGASKNDIKGFVQISSCMDKQWNGFYDNCPSVWSTNVTENLSNFKSNKCVFIFVEEENNQSEIEEILAKQTDCQLYKINFCTTITKSTERIQAINLETLNKILVQAEQKLGIYFKKCLEEFVLKLILNAISTGAHVLYGKTYKNIMVDVRVSNIKLYWRAIGIMEKLCNLKREECECYLLKSIYKGIEVDNGIDEHIRQASPEKFIVPIALVMALTKCDYCMAKKLLNESKNSVRNCIFKIKTNLNNK